MRKKNLRYYSLSFGYQGPTQNTPSDDEEGLSASNALVNAIRLAEKALNRLGLESAHEYAWPDGSLYRHVRTHLWAGHVYKKVAKELEKPGYAGLRLLDVRQHPSPNRKKKWEMDSVAERFLPWRKKRTGRARVVPVRG